MLTRSDIIKSALSFGVDEETASIAAGRIINREVLMLGFSGKLASGKDSVALGVVSALKLEPVVHMSFAQPLKEEVNQAIMLIHDRSANEAREILRVNDSDVFDEFVSLLSYALAETPGATSMTRTAGMRRVLQFWGTEVRRAEQDDYWVSKAVVNGLNFASAGKNLFYTDGRFPNEIEGPQSVGFMVIRLEVSPEVQAERLALRDGLIPDPLSLVHPSETALDDYKGFDLVTDNEGKFEDTVELVSSWIYSRSLQI
jgi:hypothetical protein